MNIQRSSFNVDVGTGLMLESLFKPTHQMIDESRVSPTTISLSDYDCIWINVYTIIRNIFESREDRKLEIANNIKDLIILTSNELHTLNSIFAIEGNKFPVYFYRTDLTNYRKCFIKNSRITTSVKKSEEFNIMSNIIDRLNSTTINKEIIGNNKKSLIVTHYPFELLIFNKFKELCLLESYTGELKKRKSYYTKFYKIKDTPLTNIPFNQLSLTIFGDNSAITPASLKLRKEVHTISINKYWNYLTNVVKMTTDINQSLKDKDLIDEYKLLLEQTSRNKLF